MKNEALRHTWDNEQLVADRLIEAVESGDAAAKQQLGARWLDGVAEHDWSHWQIVDEGLFLDRADLHVSRTTPEALIDFFEADAGVSEQRLDELGRGAPMDASELARWRESVAERAFSEEFAFERDEGIVWVVVELRHSKRGRCCVGVVDWTGFRERFVTAYRTSAEVVSALKDIGFVSEHDYRSRCDL